jgi:hypothetical protein
MLLPLWPMFLVAQRVLRPSMGKVENEVSFLKILRSGFYLFI